MAGTAEVSLPPFCFLENGEQLAPLHQKALFLAPSPPALGKLPWPSRQMLPAWGAAPRGAGTQMQKAEIGDPADLCSEGPFPTACGPCIPQIQYLQEKTLAKTQAKNLRVVSDTVRSPRPLQ